MVYFWIDRPHTLERVPLQLIHTTSRHVVRWDAIILMTTSWRDQSPNLSTTALHPELVILKRLNICWTVRINIKTRPLNSVIKEEELTQSAFGEFWRSSRDLSLASSERRRLMSAKPRHYSDRQFSYSQLGSVFSYEFIWRGITAKIVCYLFSLTSI